MDHKGLYLLFSEYFRFFACGSIFFYNLLLLFSRIGWIPCHNFIVLKPLRYNIFPIALPILNLMDVYNIITGLIQNSFLDYYYKFVKLVNVKYYGNYYK